MGRRKSITLSGEDKEKYNEICEVIESSPFSFPDKISDEIKRCVIQCIEENISESQPIILDSIQKKHYGYTKKEYEGFSETKRNRLEYSYANAIDKLSYDIDLML